MFLASHRKMWGFFVKLGNYMKYTKKTREKVLGMLENGASVQEVYESTKVSASTIYRWSDTEHKKTDNRLHAVAVFIKEYIGPKLQQEIEELEQELQDTIVAKSSYIQEIKKSLSTLEAL